MKFYILEPATLTEEAKKALPKLLKREGVSMLELKKVQNINCDDLEVKDAYLLTCKCPFLTYLMFRKDGQFDEILYNDVRTLI